MSAALPGACARIHPTIPVRNAWYLLLYAWDLARWRGAFRGDIERSPGLLALLASVLARSTGELLRRGLVRSFSSHSASIRGVRGRIDFSRSLKRLDFQAGRAHCEFPMLDADTPQNRIIRSTLVRLARESRLDQPGIASQQLRHQLRELARVMKEAKLIRPSADMFRQIQLGPSDRAYALPLAICALIQRLEMPTERSGDHALSALLRDEMTFSRLFERFLRNFWRTHLAATHEVRGESLNWHDELGCELVPSMRTDVTLTARASGCRLVVDAKYYREALGVRFGHRSFISSHLYQVYAYLRTQEHRGETYASAAGMLLYPTTTYHLDETMKVQGHVIRMATLNLGEPWEQIHQRLVSLVEGQPPPS